MVKMKNKKKNFSENVNNKKQLSSIKKLNPFEVHVNKEKMKVLGKKTKNDRGLPGVSRAKAVKKRNQTLLPEYKLKGKSNKFTDKRIGERNHEMTEEDRVVARFTAEHVKKHNKKNIFNLADDEILTHRGQTLSEIEKFDDPRSDDEDSLEGDNKSGKLESNFVKDAHFGGGLFKKTGPDGAKSHKDLIDQLIAESKKRKAEKQKIKEQTQELTEKLDTEWKDLLPLVSKTNKKTEQMEQKVDDYDKVMRELKFEARGTPSDRLKSEDEIAKEEKEKLEKLEQDRLLRMKGFLENENNKNHKSADDLDDNFAYDMNPEVTLSYNNEGVSNVEIDAELNGKFITQPATNSDDESNSAEEIDEEQSSGVETDSEDNLSDLKEDSSNSSDDDDVVEENNTNIKNKELVIEELAPAKNVNKNIAATENINGNIEAPAEQDIQEKIKLDLQQRKKIMETARNELPYTFSLPQSYDELQGLLKNQSTYHQTVIIERMIKCNHPSLSEENKESLGLLFAYLLQHISDISTDLTQKALIKECFETFNNLVPLMFDLALLNKESAQKCMLEVIKEKQSEFRKKPKCYPDLDILLYLKLTSCLFPTSDFRHVVGTPCVIYIEQMLNKCKIKTKRDIAYGIFLVTLILEYTTLSKRFLPVAINYLAGILHMAIPKRSVQLIKVIPPFKPMNNKLVLYNNYKNIQPNLKLNFNDIFDEEIDDTFKIQALYVSVKILKELNNNFIDLPSVCEIFEPIQKHLELIPIDNYPQIVYTEIENYLKVLVNNELNRKLVYLIMPKKKPKALRLYEPQVEKIFDTKKHKVQSKEKAERDKLLHKLKRERKGALREIRRDQSFLGRLKIKDKLQSDMERKEKVKRIYSEASIQQSELNTMSRKNKRLKK